MRGGLPEYANPLEFLFSWPSGEKFDPSSFPNFDFSHVSYFHLHTLEQLRNFRYGDYRVGDRCNVEHSREGFDFAGGYRYFFAERDNSEEILEFVPPLDGRYPVFQWRTQIEGQERVHQLGGPYKKMPGKLAEEFIDEAALTSKVSDT